MPELPEVETVRRGLVPLLEGRRIHAVTLHRPDLRWPLPQGFAKAIAGNVVTALDRRGKYLLWRLQDGTSVLIHLGMSGSFRNRPASNVRDKHDHVVFDLGETALVFNDPRRFGAMDLIAPGGEASHWLLKAMGPEPLSDAFTPDVLRRGLEGRTAPLKAALLDQRTVAGLGNIYVAEALFAAGLSPKRMARSVGAARAERLHCAIRAVLMAAIESGGSSLRDHIRLDGTEGLFQHRFAVYDREGQPCPGCSCDVARTGGVRRMVQSGRSTFYCPTRQR